MKPFRFIITIIVCILIDCLFLVLKINKIEDEHTLSNDSINNFSEDTLESQVAIKKSGEVIEIVSPELDSSKEIISQEEGIEEQILKGIKNWYKGTLTDTVYESEDILITNWDYNNFMPGKNLEMDEETHKLLYKYNTESDVKVSYSGEKLYIECFGNLKGCYILDDFVTLVIYNFGGAIPLNPFCELGGEVKEIYINAITGEIISYKEVNEDVKKQSYELVEKIEKLNLIDNAEKFLQYIYYSEKNTKYENFELVDIDYAGRNRFGHKLWKDIGQISNFIELQTIENNELRIITICDKFFINKNTFSMIVVDEGCYGIFTVDIKGKKIVDDEVIFKICNKDSSEVYEVTKNALLEHIFKKWEEDLSEEDSKSIKKYLEDYNNGVKINETISDEEYFVRNQLKIYDSIKNDNYDEWIEKSYFINSNMELCVLISYDDGFAAGMGISQFFYNIDKKEEIFNWYEVIHNSEKRLIDEKELKTLSMEELNIAYNEIFARYGHDFKSKELKEYFNNIMWYKPIKNKVVHLEDFTEIEKDNLQLIKAEIDRRK